MTGNRARRTGGLLAAMAIASAGCGSAVGGTRTAVSSSLPAGVMSAAQACKRVVETSARGSLHGVEQVRLVLTTYAKGEPVESGGDISSGMPPRTLVWVVAVHAKVVTVDYSHPAGYKPHGRADSYSVVMNARTGLVTDFGVSRGWPLPLRKAGTVISLPPQC